MLAAGRAACYPLGNHGYTHLNPERASSLAPWPEAPARDDAQGPELDPKKACR